MGRPRSKHFSLPPRMQQKGTRFYYVCAGPSRRWIPLGSDLAKAKRKWAELEGDQPGGLSVGDLVLRYMDREERAPGTAMQYRSYQKALAEAFPIPVAQLTSQHVALWRELQGHRKVFADGCTGLLKAACRLGKELGLSDTITVGKWLPGGSHRVRVLEPGEFRAIRSQAVEWLQVAMDLGYLTGLRPSDIRAMKWSQITSGGVEGGGESHHACPAASQTRIRPRGAGMGLPAPVDRARAGVASGPLTLCVTQKKTGTRQEFTMTDDLAAVLARARQRPILGLYVVATAKGRPVSRDMMDGAWHRACAAAGVTDAQFRDVRAMAAKQGKADGIDFQALLGHTTRAMSERYIKGRQTVVAEPVRRKL